MEINVKMKELLKDETFAKLINNKQSDEAINFIVKNYSQFKIRMIYDLCFSMKLCNCDPIIFHKNLRNVFDDILDYKNIQTPPNDTPQNYTQAMVNYWKQLLMSEQPDIIDYFKNYFHIDSNQRANIQPIIKINISNHGNMTEYGFVEKHVISDIIDRLIDKYTNINDNIKNILNNLKKY